MKVTIIGGGRGGASILKILNKMDNVNIVGIADINQDAPGIKLANQMNIFSTTSIREILHKETDIIIEATGIQRVKDEITSVVGDSITIMSSEAANLMMMLVENEEKLIGKIEKQVKQVEKLSEVTADSMEQMNDSIDNTVNLSDTLNEFASKTMDLVNETNRIINTMAKITQQTNILGLNASIEAARAGEQGRGFAIVAKEVQKLANNSEDFTKQIGEILNTINHEVVTVANEINELNGVTEKQKKIGKDLEEAIERLIANIHEL
ncbi:methyl-accepting chemotaxis protein [Alkaliphilus transvaalensis]|uniref:methyl-accepting chemotaxis protein n=1 Tax=Alkaliphilus transvaalensis TaxID=114628 RepID=UPI00047DEF5F|nr:methyl-accepting chemotaxis protein [Alkaliphilus transvaalensis]